MDAVSSALSGIKYGESWTDVTAGNIANLDTPGYTDQEVAAPSGDVTTVPPTLVKGSGSPDLATEIPNLMLSQVAVAANVATLNTVAEMYKSILKLSSSRT